MRAILALLLITGCGSSDNGAADWIGSYTTNGTLSWSGCAAPPAPISGAGTLTVVAGSSGVITTQVDGCNLNWTVSGNTVSVVAGQSCSGTLNGVNFTATWNTGAATRSGNVVTVSGVG